MNVETNEELQGHAIARLDDCITAIDEAYREAQDAARSVARAYVLGDVGDPTIAVQQLCELRDRFRNDPEFAASYERARKRLTVAVVQNETRNDADHT